MSEAMKAIKKAYTTLSAIESAADLKKHKLSLSDYSATRNIFQELNAPGKQTTTLFSNVATFYEKCNFLVVADKGHYIIWTERR